MKNKIYMIGNAHLDPVWLWQWYDGYAEVKATFRSALDRMKEFEDYKFTSAAAQYYAWIKESDPDMFEEIRRRVSEGRWCIVGGWWIQPDCNIPCDESFARQSLISQRFFKKEFGKIAKTGYNVDSFGHNAAIPKILRNSGMDSYVFMRPGPHENARLDDLFKWESDDGSSVTTYRIHDYYNIVDRTFSQFFDRAKDAERHSQMAFFGVGNHGGGPTVTLMKRMQKELDARFVYSTPDEYFKAMCNAEMPVWKEDLQFHAKGCYSANSAIKRGNRRCESMLLDCEAYGILSGKLTGSGYPAEELNRAWKNVLFNQFHDIMGGCCIKEAYDNAEMLYGESMAIADRNTNRLLQKISWNIDTLQGCETPAERPEWGPAWLNDAVGTPIVLFNPHPWSYKAFVRLCADPIRVTDASGRELPIQVVRASRTNGPIDKWGVGVNVDLPAYGYTVLRTFYSGERKEYAARVSATDTALENEYLRLEFDPQSGELVRILDKENGREMLSGKTRTVLVDETSSDTWAHGITEFKDEVETLDKGECHLLETGPLRAVMRTCQHGAHSTVRRDYALVAGNREVTVKVQVDFAEKHRMLKFRVPVNATAPRALCQIQYGTIERPTDGTEQVCQKWTAVLDGNTGLAMLNDGQYSFDCNGNVLSMTVLRGAIFADHFGARDEFCEYMEQGRHEFEYALMPFRSIADTDRKAEELNRRPFMVLETFHKGTLPLSFEGSKVSVDNVLITAIKKHEDSDAVVLRAFECEGRETDAQIEILGKPVKVSFRPHEVKTLILTEKGAKETDFLEF